MAVFHNSNKTFKTNEDTGFSDKTEAVGGRFINKDGSFNIVKRGIPLWQRWSIYNWLLSMPTWRFACTLLLFFFTINIVYTFLYVCCGINGLQGIIARTFWGRVEEIFYFSTETFTTVGYGRVNPVGSAANILASLEAVTGFSSFAVATGVMYGRFSRPKAHIEFSENAVIAPYRGIEGLMFRMASLKNKHALTDVSVRVTASLKTMENEKETYKFYQLELERKHIDNFMMNWTIVHPLNENSPLYQMTWEEIQKSDLEIYVSIHGFDDIYSNSVLKRTSYIASEIIPKAKFVTMFHESADGMTTILDLDKLNEYQLLQ